MTSKTKMRAMQRGARNHDRRPHDPSVDVYEHFDPRMNDQERFHFGMNEQSREAFLAKLDPIVRDFRQGGYTKPADVSRLLNGRKVKTAAGHAWNPRLAWFLLGMLRERAPAARKAASAPGKGSRQGLSLEEMSRREAALQAFLKR